ncbi:DMT family transporter [Amycolatopsis roodepoortensis]|uniref:Drug/metabolite transporter (DMT)-like permease n=1 Tax=Amycolatopsis roodepoortensis TaxID=700274 RepID=A0ABR9LLV1_9PSEU|nr:DMT family transporter [Amycolatopsis roodepoortensis]MBE1581639.1 drug/metabolite transporter (DMT)-like permease [Amycolatopsis roodepoortensis]
MGETKTLLRIGALALMWGSSFFWIKLGLDAFTPVQLVLARVALGAAVLIGLCYLGRDRLPSGRRIWGHLAVAAFFHNALPFLLFAWGELTVDSGITGVLNSTTPLWVLLAAPMMGSRTKMTAVRVTGLVVGLVGILLIFAPWEASGLLSWGALACLAAAASYGFAFVYEGKYLTGTGDSPMSLAGGQMLLATGFLLLAMPMGGFEPVHLSTGAVVAVVILGIGSTGIAFALNYQLLASEGAVAASIVGYLLPVVSVLLGAVFLAEPLNLRVIAGMVVVLGGVALTRLRPREQGTFATTPQVERPLAAAGDAAP